MTPMQETLVVTDLGKIRLIADPTRQAILAAFASPKTAKQVAKELGIVGTHLYHHVDLLEKSGFLTLVETRPKRGTTERILQVTAKRFFVQIASPDEKFSAFQEAFQAALAGMASAQSSNQKGFVARSVVKIRPENWDKFQNQLSESLTAMHDESGVPVATLVAAYPIVEED